MSQPCPILVINLDRSVDRLDSMTARLGQLGLKFDRIRACDSDGDGATQRPRTHLFGEFFSDLTPGERACRASHLLALRTVADSHARAVLVLEDDADLSEITVMVLKELCSLPTPPPDCISLFGKRSRGATLARIGSRHALVRSVAQPIGAVAVLWTPSGARKFVAAAERHAQRPIDVQRKHWWEAKLDAAWIAPAPVKESETLGRRSTIGPRRHAGAVATLSKWSYRTRFTVLSHWKFMARHGLAMWWRAQERIR
ncbi:MAG: glycosyltransferase family 25 protein [Phycisphaerae bacterium]|nr:glycosyltransferase family 25 protein [Phycisphaerae bacterium]